MKEIIKSNFRVEATPYSRYTSISDKEAEEMLKTIKEQISRHVDDVRADIVWDTNTVCSYCGYEWEEEADGKPVCCDKAISEWETEKKP